MRIVFYRETDERYAKIAPYVVQVNDFIYRISEEAAQDLMYQIHKAIGGRHE